MILGITASGRVSTVSGATLISSASVNGSGSSWSITQASFTPSIQAGDYLVLFERISIDPKSGDYGTVTPAGWTRQQITSNDFGEGFVNVVRLSTRVATSSEPTYANGSSISNATSWEVDVLVFRNVYKHDASSIATFSSAAPASTVVASGSADAVLYFMTDGPLVTTTLTAPVGMTEAYRVSGARNTFIGYQVVSGAASYTKTGSLTASENGIVGSIALNNTVPTVPSAPTNIKGNHYTSGILLAAFTAGSTNGGDISEYQYKLDAGAWTSISPAMYSTYGYSWLDTRFGIAGLTDRQVYSLQLRGVNAAGDGTASTAVDVSPGAYVRSYADARVTAGNASITVDKPSGTVNGDIMVMFFATNGTGTITPPSGWTNRTSLTNGNYKYHVYTKTAASEGASYTFTFTSTITTTSAIIYSVANATAYDSIQTATATAASTINVPTITPTGNGSLWIGGFYTAASGTPYPDLHADFINPSFTTSSGNERHVSGYIYLGNQDATGTRTTTGTTFGTGWATSVIIK
jgi:hypothetical protein